MDVGSELCSSPTEEPEEAAQSLDKAGETRSEKIVDVL